MDNIHTVPYGSAIKNIAIPTGISFKIVFTEVCSSKGDFDSDPLTAPSEKPRKMQFTFEAFFYLSHSLRCSVHFSTGARNV